MTSAEKPTTLRRSDALEELRRDARRLEDVVLPPSRLRLRDLIHQLDHRGEA